ncbi:GntP family permease [Pseudomonas sp. NPDC089752]|uniref:GntP family permease n=1 Tax=Pseudomonas sp. NPDC089752 TaxID=3364472 RepID=UPI0037F53D92
MSFISLSAHNLLITLSALALLMVAAYRGWSVIIFAPIAAMGAVLLVDPTAVAPAFTGLFMDKMVGFLKLYFPVIMLGALFGKLMELSGFSRSIAASAIRVLGREHGMTIVVGVCALLTYGGVSLFVAVFAVYPIAAELFRQSDIPKRLMPATIALGALTFTMDALPGSPQIQNIIPSSFFGTNSWAAPWLGVIASIFILTVGLLYLQHARRKAHRKGEGYASSELKNEPQTDDSIKLSHPALAMTALAVVSVVNFLLTYKIPDWYGASHALNLPGMAVTVTSEVPKLTAIWSAEGALLAGILFITACCFRIITARLAEGSKNAVLGAAVAAMSTASEYGFGAVIAALPGFLVISQALQAIPGPLLNEAVNVTVLSGITGSASGGLSIALAAMGDQFVAAANAANIPLEVLHRVASMASGGMDTMPHNGAVITLLAVTGLTHREAYGGIFKITLIKTAAVFFVIGAYHLTGVV